MKPLSSRSYLKNNVKKVLPSFTCVALGVFLIYFFSITLYSGIYGIKQGSLDMLEKVTNIASNTKDPISDKALDKIKNCNNVEYIVPIIGVIGGFQYKSPFGQISTEAFNVFEEDIPRLLQIFDMRLLEGKLPSPNKNELLISLKISKQDKIKIGDYIGKNSDINVTLNKKYKVCGIIDGPINTMLTTNSGNTKREEALKHNLIFSLKNENNKTINDELESMGESTITIMDYKSAYNQLNEIIRAITSLSFILNLIVIIVLCISIGNLNYILFLNRQYEFKILAAIGYKKKDLYIKILKENITLNILGFTFGIIVTIITIKLLNIIIFQPKGQYVYSFHLKSIFTAFLIPVSVSTTNMLSTLRKLRAMNYDCLNF
ncbi:ABC transporter permease [Clostridiaceae bacterium UIB06]|uniref:ABC transporter permease n=1 Tax=Clostridium thailandense TaxID=2794346 RepID=A0A949TZ84_9CLOT|nr:ABC transporter permease [Clostridium thailandense]MBV7275378.1 ABC transporter permease [Clostridium thailandense]MCH5136092.1 ABC transporter permease [Clostridiaceae bacterium UIB06]